MFFVRVYCTCCAYVSFGNLIEHLVGTGSSSIETPFPTLPEQPIGKVYNPFAVSIIESHRASMTSMNSIPIIDAKNLQFTFFPCLLTFFMFSPFLHRTKDTPV